MSRGCLVGRRLRYVIGEPVANAAALTALAADNERHKDGCICVTLDTSAIWVYDTASTAPAGPTVLLSTYGPGRWLLASGGAGGANAAGAVNLVAVRGASTANIANLASFTVAAVDGLTYVEGERILVKNQTASQNNGIYRVGAVTGGVAALTRVGEADASAEVTAGVLVYVSEGTAAGDEWWYLTTNDAIVLGTTSLTFVAVPNSTDFTSLETRLSSTEVVDSAGDSSLTLITSSIETRLSSTAVVDSAGDSSLTLITSSIETRLSSTAVVDSAGDSSLTLITSSIETRLSSTAVVDSAGDSSLTLITSSIETRLSSTEVVDSAGDSSITLITSSIETRLSSTEVVVSGGSVRFLLQEFREVDASGDVGNLAAHGGILASDSTPILRGGTNEDTEISWATGVVDIISANTSLPTDLDAAADVTVRMWVSSGVTDAATFTILTGWDQAVQVTDTADDAATKSATRHEITATIANADIPAGADTLTMQLIPAAHATDAIQLHGVRLEYTRV